MRDGPLLGGVEAGEELGRVGDAPGGRTCAAGRGRIVRPAVAGAGGRGGGLGAGDECGGLVLPILPGVGLASAGSAASGGGGEPAPFRPGMGRAPKREFIAFIVGPSLGQASDAVRTHQLHPGLDSTLSIVTCSRARNLDRKRPDPAWSEITRTPSIPMPTHLVRRIVRCRRDCSKMTTSPNTTHIKFKPRPRT